MEVRSVEAIVKSLNGAASKNEKVMPNVKARIVSLKTLLKMKRAAGRPQDLADITDLKRIEKLKRESP